MLCSQMPVGGTKGKGKGVPLGKGFHSAGGFRGGM